MKVDTRSIRISLTQFVNFTIRPGPQQLTVVKAVKKQHDEGYSIPPDLYKQFRDGVTSFHKSENVAKENLDYLADAQTEPARRKHYRILVSGYKKFLGRKKLRWFDPPRGRWRLGGLEVGIRPELGLEWNGNSHVIKLHLNETDELDKRRADVINHLMQLAIPMDRTDTPSVLDVRKARLYAHGKSDHEQTALLRAQARAFVELYRSL